MEIEKLGCESPCVGMLGPLCPLQHIRAPRWAFWWPRRVLQSCHRHRYGHRATCPHVPTLSGLQDLSAPSLCLDLSLSGQRSSCGCLCVFLWYCVLALLVSCGLACDWTCRLLCMLVTITDELGLPARNHLVTILLCFPACS